MKQAARATTPRSTSVSCRTRSRSLVATSSAAESTRTATINSRAGLRASGSASASERIDAVVREGDDEHRALGRRRSGQVERRILAEDRELELAQAWPRLDPELVDEPCPRGLEGGERLRLAARPVEREHQLAAQPLAQRVLRDERLELGDELGVPTEREVGLDPPLERSSRSSSSRAIAGCANAS